MPLVESEYLLVYFHRTKDFYSSLHLVYVSNEEEREKVNISTEYTARRSLSDNNDMNEDARHNEEICQLIIEDGRVTLFSMTMMIFDFAVFVLLTWRETRR